jgi:hypothetical protein
MPQSPITRKILCNLAIASLQRKTWAGDLSNHCFCILFATIMWIHHAAYGLRHDW